MLNTLLQCPPGREQSGCHQCSGPGVCYWLVGGVFAIELVGGK